MVARRGKVAYVASFGYRNLESKEPMTVDTIFAIASMTKPITCVWVMRLVEQGKIGLDDPISKYLPELKDLRVLGDPKYDTENEVATLGRSPSQGLQLLPALGHGQIASPEVADPVRSPCVDFSPVLVRGPDSDRAGGELGGGLVAGLIGIESDEPARGGQHPGEHGRVGAGAGRSQGDDARLWKLLAQQEAVE